MKARLVAVLVDLLLDCFTLLIARDDSPGIRVSTLPELAAALLLEDEHPSAVNGTDVMLIDRVEIHGDEEVITEAVGLRASLRQ